LKASFEATVLGSYLLVLFSICEIITIPWANPKISISFQMLFFNKNQKRKGSQVIIEKINKKILNEAIGKRSK